MPGWQRCRSIKPKTQTKTIMTIKIQRFVLAMFAVLLAVTVVGCRNTAHGVGEDVEKVGDKIQEKTD
jgi:predicted small secreted protein